MRLRLLAELVERLNRAESRDEVCEAALDGMVALLGADRASILLFGGDDRVHFVAWRGLSERYRAAVDGHSPWQRGDAGAQPFGVPDVAASEDLSDELKATIRDEGIGALAFFPLARRAHLLGKFMTYQNRPQPFGAEQIHLGKVVAVHLAAALGRILDHEELGRNEERYRSLFEESRDPIYISTPEGRMLDVNPAGVQLFGYSSREELLARDVSELYWDPTQRDRFLRMISESGAVTDLEVELRTRNGSRCRVLETATAVRDGEGRFVAFRGTLRDVTEQRHLEEQLRQAQKMEAVGRLAGGVAHDFNNLLTAINGYSELLLRRFPPEDPARREAEEIHRAGRRAAELTRQLLALSRRQILSPRTLDLNRSLADMEQLLRRVLGEDLELIITLDADPAAVRCDPGQLEQVVLNLAVNARDAMPRGGRLEIVTRGVHLDDAAARRLVDARAGDYVELRISDSGTGMPPEVLEHIFEPFFTTKDHGKGTGLGLSTVYGIVRQSGAQIEVTSHPGEGSTFRVLFPLAQRAPEADEPRPGGAALPAGHETVLLVEDERAVRHLLASALRGVGYQVLEASDGEQALQLALAHPAAIHLLLSDLVMPRLGGAELATRLAVERPAMRVVFISGYADRAGTHALDGRLARVPFLQKPFPTDLLVRTVRAALDAPAPGPRPDKEPT